MGYRHAEAALEPKAAPRLSARRGANRGTETPGFSRAVTPAGVAGYNGPTKTTAGRRAIPANIARIPADATTKPPRILAILPAFPFMPGTGRGVAPVVRGLTPSPPVRGERSSPQDPPRPVATWPNPGQVTTDRGSLGKQRKPHIPGTTSTVTVTTDRARGDRPGRG